jgi:hypothetical protein
LPSKEGIRAEVLRFAEEMERVLKDNDRKLGWTVTGIDFLATRLLSNLSTFMLAYNSAFLEPQNNVRGMMQKCMVDIANYAMIIWDKLNERYAIYDGKTE